MKATESKSKQSSARYEYTTVKDARKHPIRGLWKRNGRFVARLTVEDDAGRKRVRRCTLKATTEAEAAAELKTLHVERAENRLRHIGATPKLADYARTYLDRIQVGGKRPATIVKERGCLSCWSKAVGHLRLDQVRPHHVTAFITGLKRGGLSGRTANLYVICLRNCLKSARTDGFLKALPTEGIAWQKFDTKKRDLVTAGEIEALCAIARQASKNGGQLADYLRLMAYSGARRNEALRLRWRDVDFDRAQLTIGAEGDTKNREPRHVDFNPALEAHLRDMASRRAPDSDFLFPSPQRGERDAHAMTFMESLRLTRRASGCICLDCGKAMVDGAPAKCGHCQSARLERRERLLPEKLQRFGFHDCRHHFISFAIMSGIDFMTIARWVGHKDGGILIGKVYGHLSNEHTKAQAARLNFGPVIVEAAASQ